jgi:hypothetical protein
MTMVESESYIPPGILKWNTFVSRRGARGGTPTSTPLEDVKQITVQ